MAADVPSARCPQCGQSFTATVRICPNDGTVLEHDAGSSRIGQVLDGKYRLDAFLSHGGMGSVFRATHVMLGKTVAVKLINPELVTSPEIVRRFQREARAATALHHPNIVGVYDLGQTSDGTLYIAMEFVDGPSLKSVIASGGPVAPTRTIAVLRQVGSALSFAHRHNVIHRDLKPHNIMLAVSEEGQEIPKLVDFGIAKTFDEATQLTMTGFALGTPQYMSPEQAEARPVDARSDIYSLGVILYEMLAGEVPFNDPSAPAILIKHIKDAPVAPSQKNPQASVPPELEAIALKCLEKDPVRRFQSADEFVSVLEEAAASVPGGAAALLGTVVLGRTPTGAPGVSATSPTQPLSAAPFPGESPRTGTVPDAGRSRPTIAQGPAGTAQSPAGPDSIAAPPAAATVPRAAPAAGSPASRAGDATSPTAGAVVAAPIASSGESGAAAARRSSDRHALVAIVVVGLVAVGGAAALFYIRQKPQGQAAPAAMPAEPPRASPAMATDTGLSGSQSQAAPGSPAAAADAGAGEVSGDTPVAGRLAAGRASGNGPDPRVSAGASGRAVAAGAASGSPGPDTAGNAHISAPARLTSDSRAPGSTTPDIRMTGRQPAKSGAPGSAPSAPPLSPTSAPPAFPAHPVIVFACRGTPDVCPPLGSAVEEALGKAGFTSVRNPARADIGVTAVVAGVQERVSQEFKTTFAVRTYSIALTGEVIRSSEAVPMPAPTTLSFDPQFGGERVVEKARLVAGDLVERIRGFVQKKTEQ